jgi:hypothetical protein
VHTSQAQAQSHAAEVTQECASLSSLVNEWEKGVEGQWGGVQEEWAQECAHLAQACDEWELRVHAVEKSLEGKIDAGLTALEFGTAMASTPTSRMVVPVLDLSLHHLPAVCCWILILLA